MTNPTRSRIRRILKWTGVLVCVVSVLTWGLSIRWAATLLYCKQGPAMGVGFGHGVLFCSAYKQPPAGLFEDGNSFRFHLHDIAPRARTYGLFWPTLFGNELGMGMGTIVMPLWLFPAAALMPTALLFWRDRRRIPPGHCQRCGYDLTGNVSGVCSECGTPIASD